MKLPSRGVQIVFGFGLVVLTFPLWLPLLGAALAEDDGMQAADVALVLEGTGPEATDAAEVWRQQGLVRDVVIVEAPVKTHALVAYWSEFVQLGLARPSSTPAQFLRIVRADSTQAAEQARAALSALRDDAAGTVLVAGGGGIGSRLVERQLASVLGPAGIEARMVRSGENLRDPRDWAHNANDRRAVLDSWLQFLVPFLSDG